MTTETRPSALCGRIDAIIAEKSILKHPFYQRWQAGEMTLGELKGYTCQYYQHVLAFPRYVSGTHANCDDLADRQELLENLREEEEGPNNHPELWLRFGEAIGLQREDMTGAEPLPETTALDESFRRITKDSPFIAGIASLYAYESQVPEVAGTKMEGLKRYYGVDSPDGLRFFVVHHSLDVEHSAVTRNMVARYAEAPGAEESAVGAVEEACDALWGFLDGCYREYVEAAA
ncbi:MAG TPA: CADD family putative folate metabolism protein [Dehalococcoidia bacterium]